MKESAAKIDEFRTEFRTENEGLRQVEKKLAWAEAERDEARRELGLKLPANKPMPKTNAKGWVLHTDKNGRRAYVSPDGTQFEEVK
jgi:hypothetical protein